MKQNTFPTAEFYDAASDETYQITVDQYDADTHEGRIQCPAEDCDAALIFVPEFYPNGYNNPTSPHFKKNSHGDPHSEGCSFAPGLSHERITRMQDALREGFDVLINVNFLTSFKRTALPKAVAKKAMADVDGEYRPTWIKEHRGQYAPFAVSDIERVSARLKEYRIASKNLGQNIDTSRLVVSHLHGAFPWASFYTADMKGSITTKPADSKGIFQELYDQSDNVKAGTNLWRPSPVLKMGVQPWANYARGNSIPTHTPRDRTIQIDDNEYKVQDVLIVSDASLKTEIQNTSSINFVATPYIDPEHVQRQIDQEKGFVHLNWAISNEDQISFE